MHKKGKSSLLRAVSSELQSSSCDVSQSMCDCSIAQEECGLAHKINTGLGAQPNIVTSSERKQPPTVTLDLPTSQAKTFQAQNN